MDVGSEWGVVPRHSTRHVPRGRRASPTVGDLGVWRLALPHPLPRRSVRTVRSDECDLALSWRDSVSHDHPLLSEAAVFSCHFISHRERERQRSPSPPTARTAARAERSGPSCEERSKRTALPCDVRHRQKARFVTDASAIMRNTKQYLSPSQTPPGGHTTERPSSQGPRAPARGKLGKAHTEAPTCRL